MTDTFALLRRFTPSPAPCPDPVGSRLLQLPGGIGIFAYASRIPGADRYISYAKAFRGGAASYWDVQDCFAKFASEAEHDAPTAALDDVMQVALAWLLRAGKVEPATVAC